MVYLAPTPHHTHIYNTTFIYTILLYKYLYITSPQCLLSMYL